MDLGAGQRPVCSFVWIVRLVSSLRTLPSPRLWKFPSSPKSFIVLCFTFKSVIHFELIFVCDYKYQCNFTLLHVAFHVSQNYLLKRLFFFFPLYVF